MRASIPYVLIVILSLFSSQWRFGLHWATRYMASTEAAFLAMFTRINFPDVDQRWVEQNQTGHCQIQNRQNRPVPPPGAILTTTFNTLNEDGTIHLGASWFLSIRRSYLRMPSHRPVYI